ncbi:nucleoside 2-deoxyribosyltransferase [Leuconostocaceae bacterium ESL0723]|nr:nucleoside 2-deoxyribosyltransferase [Lactobacillaceae bacterium L1_55_11]WEV55091.1 nucleoside 2-deoxyribosyltransferase [Leuconostocaceae bacterium ESL0723]
MAKKVYLAGPFFNEDQIDRVSRVEQALGKNDTVAAVFSPRQHNRDEFEMYSDEWRVATFNDDVDALNDAEVVVAIVDYVGEEVDPGTAWEFGYAIAKRKPVVVLKETPGPLNLMLAMPLTACLASSQDLVDYDFDLLPVQAYVGDTF